MTEVAWGMAGWGECPGSITLRVEAQEVGHCLCNDRFSADPCHRTDGAGQRANRALAWLNASSRPLY